MFLPLASSVTFTSQIVVSVPLKPQFGRLNEEALFLSEYLSLRSWHLIQFATLLQGQEPSAFYTLMPQNSQLLARSAWIQCLGEE